jgi:hypothetical protein
MFKARWGLLAVAAAAAAVLAACAGAPGGSQPNLISVTGMGIAHLPPDVVHVTLGVQTRGDDIARTVAENNRQADDVVAALREMGVAEEDVQTAYFNVSTQAQYDDFGNPTGAVTYWVDNTLNVTFREPARLGELLQAALDAGANSVQGVNYTVEDVDALLDEARQAALEDARAQAEQLAAAAGAQLGPVYSISEAGFSGGMPALRDKGAAAGVPTSQGTLEYQVQVYVSYILR